MPEPKSRGLAAKWLIIVCGIWNLGLGLYFMFIRPALLPEDLRYMALDPQVLQTTAPRLADWLGKVFTVMGEFMSGAGVLIVYVGWAVMPPRPRGAVPMGLMSAINFVLHSDFRWLLVVPVALWAVALVLYVRTPLQH